MNDIVKTDAAGLRDMVAGGTVTAVAVTEAYLDAAEERNPAINAFVTISRREALEQAADVDRRLAAGEPAGSLAGVPVAVKDNICTRGIATTCASRMLAGFVPPYDAAVVEALRRAGAVMVGKTNMDEFAMGSSSETSAAGAVRNPHDTTRVPGGSSGGSAAAVAAGCAPVALGSDTGGSIRQPAAFCGVVGCKPTYGRVSRYGLVAYASSLDQIGPFGRSVRDAALLLQAVAGYDTRDSTSADVPVPALDPGTDVPAVQGVRFGVPDEYLGEAVDPDVRDAVERAAAALEAAGAERVPVSLPHTSYAVAAYYIIASAEASSNLARYDGVKFGARAGGSDGLEEMYRETRTLNFGTEVRRRIMLGTYALSSGYYDAYYLKALKVRTLVKGDFDRAFDACDVLLTPVAPSVAFGLGEKTDDPMKMYLSDACTIPCNLAGIPGVSLPCGTGAHGMPAGVQLLGAPFTEDALFRYAAVIEAAVRNG